MSAEKAIIARARPLILQKRVEHLFSEEKKKGCDPRLFSFPVALEPPFTPIVPPNNFQNSPACLEVNCEVIPSEGDLLRLQVWIPTGGELNWDISEFFLKQLSQTSHRIGFELIGNRAKILFIFLVHKDDLPVVETSYQGSFERSELTEVSDLEAFKGFSEAKQLISFIDFSPPPPYSHLLTRSDELKVSPYQSFIAALMNIEPPDRGFYQALFQPVHPQHNWHRNVEALLDIEYVYKLMGSPVPQRFLQQAPSGDLRQMARDVETKSHNDKPFYFLACRAGAISENNPHRFLKSLSIFFNLFQHGGRPMQSITDLEYRPFLSNEEIEAMFHLGLTYRPGFLVNSSELSGLVHVPPADILGYRNPGINIIRTLPVLNKDIHEGTPLGSYDYTGKSYPVCIPLYLRPRSTHIIGRSGTVKSTTMAHMILDDIKRGMGVAVIDPHGDLIKDLLRCIPQEHIERTIYFDLTIPGHVPIWNSLHRSRGQDISQTAENIVASMKTVFKTGWGDRMGSLLHHGLFALGHIPGSSLLDLSNILYKRDKKSSIQDEPLVREFLENIDNDTAKRFWRYQVRNYSSEAFDPPKHRLDKLLLSGKASLMLSQPESLIDFREMMDSGKIFLVNLSLIGREVAEILGSFILSLLHLTSMGRADSIDTGRKPFQIYVDEAHRFVSDALDNLIAEARKFGVGLTLAHQFFSQFGNTKVDALSSVGTTIIMNVDSRDAGYLVKDLGKEVTPNDLTSLKIGEAVVRIDTDIVKIKTLGPLNIPAINFKDQIIKHSLSHYYRPEKVVKEMIRQKQERYNEFIFPLSDPKDTANEEFNYDDRI